MTMTNSGDRVGSFGSGSDAPKSARETVNEMVEAGLLDGVLARIDDQSLQLTGEGGFLPEMVKAVLERGLQAELSEHLGYEKGDPAGICQGG